MVQIFIIWYKTKKQNVKISTLYYPASGIYYKVLVYVFFMKLDTTVPKRTLLIKDDYETCLMKILIFDSIFYDSHHENFNF